MLGALGELADQDTSELRASTSLAATGHPHNLSFAASTALLPSGELRDVIEPDYERECARLFYGPHPPFPDVLKRLQALRDLL